MNEQHIRTDQLLPNPVITTEVPPAEIVLPHFNPEVAAALEEAQRLQDAATPPRELATVAIGAAGAYHRQRAGGAEYDKEERELQKRMEEQKRALERERAEKDRLEKERRARETQRANEKLEEARRRNEEKKRK